MHKISCAVRLPPDGTIAPLGRGAESSQGIGPSRESVKRAPNAVLFDPEIAALDRTDRALVAALLMVADGEGVARTTGAELAARAGVSVRTVARRLFALCARLGLDAGTHARGVLVAGELLRRRSLPWGRPMGRAWVAELAALPSDRLVLATYLSHAGPTGESWPSGDRVASIAGVSRRTVLRAHKRLLEARALVSRRLVPGQRYPNGLPVSGMGAVRRVLPEAARSIEGPALTSSATAPASDAARTAPGGEASEVCHRVASSYASVSQEGKSFEETPTRRAPVRVADAVPISGRKRAEREARELAVDAVLEHLRVARFPDRDTGRFASDRGARAAVRARLLTHSQGDLCRVVDFAARDLWWGAEPQRMVPRTLFGTEERVERFLSRLTGASSSSTSKPDSESSAKVARELLGDAAAEILDKESSEKTDVSALQKVSAPAPRVELGAVRAALASLARPAWAAPTPNAGETPCDAQWQASERVSETASSVPASGGSARNSQNSGETSPDATPPDVSIRARSGPWPASARPGFRGKSALETSTTKRDWPIGCGDLQQSPSETGRDSLQLPSKSAPMEVIPCIESEAVELREASAFFSSFFRPLESKTSTHAATPQANADAVKTSTLFFPSPGACAGPDKILLSGPTSTVGVNVGTEFESCSDPLTGIETASAIPSRAPRTPKHRAMRHGPKTASSCPNGKSSAGSSTPRSKTRRSCELSLATCGASATPRAPSSPSGGAKSWPIPCKRLTVSLPLSTLCSRPQPLENAAAVCSVARASTPNAFRSSKAKCEACDANATSSRAHCKTRATSSARRGSVRAISRPKT